MKRRTAETLIEIVTAMTVFGVVSSGVFDFMAAQTINLARAKDREKMMHAAQLLMSCQSFDVETSQTAVADTGVEYTFTDGTLTLFRNKEAMTLKIK